MRTALITLVLAAISLPWATAQKIATASDVSGGGSNDSTIARAHGSHAHMHHARHHVKHS
jgi:hypothetical protein